MSRWLVRRRGVTMKREQLMDLVARMRYQYPIGVSATTMGVCSRCREMPARGGRVCPECLTKELAALIGYGHDFCDPITLADDLEYAIADQAAIINRLLELCDDG